MEDYEYNDAKTIDDSSCLDNGKLFCDLIEARRTEVNRGHSKPVSFKNVFGDLSEFTFAETLDLEGLNLCSLEGCPTEIISGDLVVCKNPSLKSLKHIPHVKDSDPMGFVRPTLYLNLSQINLLNTINIDSYSYLHINLTEKEVSSKSIVKAFKDFRKTNGDFKKIKGIAEGDLVTYALDYVELEKIYSIYKKLDFDSDKLDRALELL